MTREIEAALFIFRRDLRLNDNTALNHALRMAKKVIPIFIFDPQQIGSGNPYRSMNAIQFMVESLKDLEKQLKAQGGKLFIFKGSSEKIIQKCINVTKANAVFVNADYTPFSIKRDKAIAQVCRSKEVEFHSFHDVLLNEPELIKTGNNTPYAVFTPFYKKSWLTPVLNPIRLANGTFFTGRIADAQSGSIYKTICKTENKDLHVHGGSKVAKKILGTIAKFKNYTKERDLPAIHTTHLSAHLKFGTISIRDTFHTIKKKLGSSHPLLRQLYWRDFWTYVAYHSPFVYGQPYHTKYKNLWWSKSKTGFEKWCTGQTGFPIVDAGMHQLNTTGFMHNRVRMIVASFLTKDLHIDWRWGEKYFAQQLVDYDPAVNNGNWQWSASTGCDGQPYFRIFNPWLQQAKFDPDCTYIKKWIPELKKIPAKTIHTWYKLEESLAEYPLPMVDHKVESALAKELYKKTK